ncbi:hypothetical protein OROGR_032294 [Orobanche gracilis]
MSSRVRDNGIGFVRRMVNIPRSLLDEFSRAMNQGLDLIEGRRNYHQNLHSQQSSTFDPFRNPSNFPPQHPPMVQEEWAFLSTFEQQYGTIHPFFYACRFTDALKIARDEHKLMLMYIHSPEHPFIPSFCRETLCSELIVEFLDANYVCWGGLASRGEGLQMANSLRVSSFPFCAVVDSADGDNLSVLEQLEGPVSPDELVEVLQRTMEEEQGVAFGNGGSKQDENRRLREEQDIANVAALQIDQERDRLQKKSSSEVKQATFSGESSQKAHTSGGEKAEKVTQILIRFPTGERRERSFSCTDKIRAIYGYVDSLGLSGVENYRLISNFPRQVYGFDQMGLSLKEAGLHPKASLFLELL